VGFWHAPRPDGRSARRARQTAGGASGSTIAVEHYRGRGILPYVLRQLLAA
jgi:hypothetical protein